MSARLLIAVADDETARRAAAQAREADLEVVDIVADLEELHRALRRLDVDVVLLYDALGGMPVLDLARELAGDLPRGRPDPARRRGLARRCCARRCRPACATWSRCRCALELFEASVRAAAQWSRTMRDRVTGEESRGRRAGRPADRRRRRQGRRGDDHLALHLGARGRPAGARPARLPRRLRPAEGRLPRAAGHAAPAQRRRPRRRRQRDLRPPPAGDALHAQGRVPRAAGARGGRARRGRRLRGGPQRAQRRQGPPRADRGGHRRRRHRGHARSPPSWPPRCSSSPRRTCSRCAACAACATCGSGSACARTRTSRSCSTRPRAGARSSRTWRARSSARRWPRPRSRRTSARWRRRSTPVRRARMEDGKLRGAFEALALELDIVPHAEEAAAGGRSRAGCWPASAASAASPAPSSWGCCRWSSWSSSPCGRSR